MQERVFQMRSMLFPFYIEYWIKTTNPGKNDSPEIGGVNGGCGASDVGPPSPPGIHFDMEIMVDEGLDAIVVDEDSSDFMIDGAWLVCVNCTARMYSSWSCCRLNATWAAITRCLSAIKLQSGQLQSRHLQNRLWPFRMDTTPWLRHL